MYILCDNLYIIYSTYVYTFLCIRICERSQGRRSKDIKWPICVKDALAAGEKGGLLAAQSRAHRGWAAPANASRQGWPWPAHTRPVTWLLENKGSSKNPPVEEVTAQGLISTSRPAAAAAAAGSCFESPLPSPEKERSPGKQNETHRVSWSKRPLTCCPHNQEAAF